MVFVLHGEDLERLDTADSLALLGSACKLAAVFTQTVQT